MAKTDSFFIRAIASCGTAALGGEEVTLDLGSFVNLGVTKSTIMRIHNIAVQWAVNGNVTEVFAMAADGCDKVAFQLTTQSQSDMVNATDKSLISSGSLQAYLVGGTAGELTGITQDLDVSPQDWQNGYLVAVDSLFLRVKRESTSTAGINDSVSCAIVIECTLENASQASALALSLSQF